MLRGSIQIDFRVGQIGFFAFKIGAGDFDFFRARTVLQFLQPSFERNQSPLCLLKLGWYFCQN